LGVTGGYHLAPPAAAFSRSLIVNFQLFPLPLRPQAAFSRSLIVNLQLFPLPLRPQAAFSRSLIVNFQLSIISAPARTFY
jgi:hypothetical protein